MKDGTDCDSIGNTFFGFSLFDACTGVENSEGRVYCEIDYRDVLLLPRQEETEKGQAIGDVEA